MEKARRGGENIYRNRLMSSNDHARNWYLREKQIKENALMQDNHQLKQNRKEERNNFNECYNHSETHKISKSLREKKEEKLRSKSQRKDLINLELKPCSRSKATREPNYESHMERKRFHKPLDKNKAKELTVLDQEVSWPKRKLSSFHNTWEYTNYSVVPILTSNRAKDCLKRERKKKHSDRVRRKSETVQRSETNVENAKNAEITWGGSQRDKQIEVLYPPFRDFGENRPNYTKQKGGEAVVIYQRRDRDNYLHPQTGDGCRFEQISFSGSCETTVDLVQSKRSLSELPQNSTREFYVARRRTRFQLDPYKKTPTQSDFHSAMDFLKQSNPTGISEFRDFEEMNNSVSRFVYNNPSQECQNWGKKNARYSIQPTVKKSKSSSESSAIVRARLRQTAEKKLDLHKEMIRAEEMSKKKFWESIERSLNYRCAVAEMFSSQSYLSSNDSSKFFRNVDNPAGRSTNIYVRESFIKKISSYQGFNRFIRSNKYGFKNKSNTPSNSTYSQMKAVLDTFLIQEHEEEIFLNRQLKESYISRTFSDNIGQTDFTLDEFNNSISLSASEMLNLMENNLCNSDTHSKLELLMSKLSEEIRKCSKFIQTFSESMTEKVAKRSLPKLSASDSEIKLNKKSENRMSKKTIVSWMSSDPIVNPSLFYSASMTSLNLTEDRHHKKQKSRTPTEHDASSLDPTVMNDFERPEKTESIQSIFSYRNRSEASTNVPHKKQELSCCDDCRVLKQRIIRLEKELGKIERRMPLYPKECQESIKNCLQSLNGTSETFLKRLKSCAKLKYLDSKSRKLCKFDSKRSMSAPGPIIEERVKKKLSTMPNNSDYQLNVGMEITMENVDPVTGKKLFAEANKNTQQEGKIQCRMFKDGEKPVLLMDTDFSYNPTTGMLFKNKKSHSTETTSADFIIPMDSVIKKSPSALDLIKTYRTPLQTYECQNIDVRSFKPESVQTKTVKKDYRDMSTQGSSWPLTDVEMISNLFLKKESRSKENMMAKVSEVGTSAKSEDILVKVSDSDETRPESKEFQKRPKIFWFNRRNNEKAKKSFSRIPVRKKKNPSSAHSRTDSMSRKSSLMSFDTIPPLSEFYLSSSCTSKNFLKNSERSKRILKSLHRIIKKPASRERSFMHKSTQTYEKFKKNSESKIQTKQAEVQAVFEVRHFGVQTAVKNRSAENQVYSGSLKCQNGLNAESELESPSCSLTGNSLESNCQSLMTYSEDRSNQSMTVNVAIQADNPSKKECETVSVGFQTNLPSEENLKYLNDLQIQKKVNMAIAELCFHLSQNDGTQKV